jgi:hypothetical protein
VGTAAGRQRGEELTLSGMWPRGLNCPLCRLEVEASAGSEISRVATGFSTGEYGTSGKWLELLTEIAPSITQVGILHDAQNPSSIPQFAAMQSLARSLGVELKSLPLRDVDEVDRIVAAFARGSNLGLIATRIGAAIGQRDLIIALAARHRLPAVYPLRFFVTGDGLVSYGPNIDAQQFMSLASSRARARLTYRCKRRPNSSL